MTVRTAPALRRRTAAGLAAALTVGALLATPATAAPSSPATPAVATASMTVLSTGVPGKPYSEPTGLNDAGVVVGYAWADGQGRAASAIRWNQDLSPTVLPPLPGEDYAQALGVNGAGTVIGISWPAPREQSDATAVRWSAGGTPTALPPLPGDTFSRPIAVSVSGTVVGTSSHGAQDHPVAWRPDGTAVALAPLPGDTEGLVYDVNGAGLAVGFSYTGIGPKRATVWGPDGTPTPFVTDPAAVESGAYRINEAGAVVGGVDLPLAGGGSAWHGVIRSADGILHDLGPQTYASRITSSGSTVGAYQPDPTRLRTYAARWSPDGVRAQVDLEQQPEGQTTAEAVNESGTVVGYLWSGIPAREYQSGLVWAPDGSVTNLEPAGQSSARFVNDSGLVVGLWLPRPVGNLYPHHLAAVWRP
ncbi:hypothetical protein ACFRMQ_16870 [Kitasatospora sp. NPDC056783]|uniref:hypothetical protein n=1 Tax=Kitasatospora sp. NPDC056783 TaxID=3345943 RepID=UPI00367F1C4C